MAFLRFLKRVPKTALRGSLKGRLWPTGHAMRSKVQALGLDDGIGMGASLESLLDSAIIVGPEGDFTTWGVKTRHAIPALEAGCAC